MNFKFVTILTLAGLFILFVLQNIAQVQISFLLWSFEMSRFLLLFLVFAAGLISGWVLSSLKRSRKQGK